MPEIWKDIKGYENLYMVSNLGQVKSLDRIVEYIRYGKPIQKTIKGKILKPIINVDGYCKVSIYKNKKIRIISIHRLVYDAFNGNLSNALQIDHIDRNKLNNCADNLRQISQRENIHNSSVVKGIVGISQLPSGNWRARITINRKEIHIGCYKTKLGASIAYNNYLNNI